MKIHAVCKITNGSDIGDLVQCCNCGKIMLVNSGEEICPECNEDGTLKWLDNKQERSIYDDDLILE